MSNETVFQNQQKQFMYLNICIYALVIWSISVTLHYYNMYYLSTYLSVKLPFCLPPPRLSVPVADGSWQLQLEANVSYLKAELHH